MRQDARLNVVALGDALPSTPRLNRSSTTSTELKVLSVTSLGRPVAAHELQVQQSADAAAFVVQAQASAPCSSATSSMGSGETW